MNSDDHIIDTAIAVLAQEIIELATAQGVRIAVAESLTGGLVSAALVAVPGASQAFSGGIVAYDTQLKTTLLGVESAQLERTGPVDAGVARAMAAGARTACGGAAFGVSTTGVAGPGADPHTGQPAGTVWIGVSSARGERAELLSTVRVLDTRAVIRGEAVRAALELLVNELRDN